MKIIIYTKTGCPWAIEVIDLLRDKNIPFEERDIYKNPAWGEEVIAKSGQSKSPTLDIDGYILADSDAEQVEAYLKSKGVLN